MERRERSDLPERGLDIAASIENEQDGLMLPQIAERESIHADRRRDNLEIRLIEQARQAFQHAAGSYEHRRI